MRVRPLQTLMALGLFSLAACGSPPRAVVQDVAFLVPLVDARDFITAREVMPRALFDRLQPLTVSDEPDDLYSALAVVGLRLDACFQEGAPPSPCQAQVRLVFQPVFDDPMAGVTTRDAAVHVFFNTSPDEVVTAAKALIALRSEQKLNVEDALTGPHPGFADAVWKQKAKAAVSPLMNPERLVRMTSMGVHASGQAWVFSGIDISDGVPTDIQVPTLALTTEGHVTSTGGALAVEVTIDPGSTVEPSLTPVIAKGGLSQATPEQLAAAVTSVARLEDPSIHNPGTVDCATCHVAALTRLALESKGLTFQSPFTASAAFADTRNLRAFGYFFTQPALSPRLLREAALVRDDFNHRLEQAP